MWLSVISEIEAGPFLPIDIGAVKRAFYKTHLCPDWKIRDRRFYIPHFFIYYAFSLKCSPLWADIHIMTP